MPCSACGGNKNRRGPRPPLKPPVKTATVVQQIRQSKTFQQTPSFIVPKKRIMIPPVKNKTMIFGTIKK